MLPWVLLRGLTVRRWACLARLHLAVVFLLYPHRDSIANRTTSPQPPGRETVRGTSLRLQAPGTRVGVGELIHHRAAAQLLSPLLDLAGRVGDQLPVLLRQLSA